MSDPFAQMAASLTQPTKKEYRGRVIAAAEEEVKKLKVGGEVRIKAHKNLMPVLRRKTGLALISCGWNKEGTECTVRRLPDGTKIYRGIKSASFRSDV